MPWAHTRRAPSEKVSDDVMDCYGCTLPEAVHGPEQEEVTSLVSTAMIGHKTEEEEHEF